MEEGNLKSVAQRLLAGVGLPHHDLIHEALPLEHFGDGEVVFRIGPLCLRFVRERGQDFVDVGPASTPGEYHRFGDVELAMGWKTVDQAWTRSEPEPLSAILERLRNRYEELAAAYWSASARDTAAKVDDTAQLRAARVLFHLRCLVAEAEGLGTHSNTTNELEPIGIKRHDAPDVTAQAACDCVGSGTVTAMGVLVGR